MSPDAKGAQRPADIDVRRVIGAGGIVAASVVLALGISRALLAELGAGIDDPSRAPRELPPPPREQVHPTVDYQQYRAAEQARLEAYAWLDRGAGIVQIPIERAMALVASGETAAAPADRGRPP
jgi:hypothetical protein